MALPKLRASHPINHDDYRGRLPPYIPTASDSSRREWKLMQDQYLPDPPPSKAALEKEFNKLGAKRAVFRRIVLASQTGDVKTLRKLLWANRKVSLNKKYGEDSRKLKGSGAKLTPLCWAALNGHLDVVTCLLDGVSDDPVQTELTMLEDLSKVLRGEKSPGPLSSRHPSLAQSSLLTQSSSVFSSKSLAKSSYASTSSSSMFGSSMFGSSTFGSSTMLSSSKPLTRTANKELCDTEGRTPLMLATYGGHLDVVCSLLERGSKMNPVDRYGRNVLDYARQKRADDIMNVLIDTRRERKAHAMEMQREEEARLKEYFAAILARVAEGGGGGGGSKKNGGANKISMRKQRPMTAPSFRRRGGGMRRRVGNLHTTGSRGRQTRSAGVKGGSTTSMRRSFVM